MKPTSICRNLGGFHPPYTDSLASAKIADKKQEHADREMELLQKAVKAGWKKAEHTARDTDLDPLRAREDFKKLLSDLERKPATKPARQP